MKCKNARLEDEMIRFDCPSCGVDADLNEETLDELWLNFQGQVTCPLPEGCNTQYTIPSRAELDALRAVPATDDPVSEPDPDEAKDSEEPEPEKPKFTGPFRYESKSETGGSDDDEFQQALAQNRQEESKPASPLSIRTFRRIDCVQQGKDCFDETVSEFLGEIGKENIISVTPVSYTEKTDKCTDYGVVIYYNTPESLLAEAESATAEPVIWRD